MTVRTQILVRGIVQGVGFRPFIFALANKSSLTGEVLNNAAGVLIDVEGEAAAIERFISEIKRDPPPLSMIESIETHNQQIPANFKNFRIVESNAIVRAKQLLEEGKILACGAELKNTFCLARDDYAFLSHHIGDLENLETLKSFTEGVEHYKRLFNLAPEIVAYDIHPEYLSTKYAVETDAEKIGVQHRHAHIASCLADNRSEGAAIGVAMDGTGFGTDGKIWVGEFFVADNELC